MKEFFPELNDFNLKEYLSKFPIDPTFQVPVLSADSDILELFRKLKAPHLREPGIEQLEKAYQLKHDQYTPIDNPDNRFTAPYCVGAEGEIRGEGWKALVYDKLLESVAQVEHFAVKKPLYENGSVINALVLEKDSPVILKKSWQLGKISEPNGVYFDTLGIPYIVSPPVVAMFYDAKKEPHFYYDKRRLKRSGDDKKASGFVWQVRPAKLGGPVEAVLRRFIDKNEHPDDQEPG